MADLQAVVKITLRDVLSSQIKKTGSNVSSFASSASTAIQKVDKAFSGLATAAGAIGVSLSLGAASKEIIDFDDKLIGLGVQANVSAQKVNELKNKIYETASAPTIKLSTSDLTAALDSVIERTGDMKFAEENLTLMGQAMRATGASGEDIGGLFAEFQKMGLGADTALIALDTLTLQGKEGAFTLQNLAALGPRTISAYTATGRTGAAALSEMGAALQVIRMGTGSSEQAATAFEAVMRNLTAPDKQSKLRQLGVSVKDQEGNFRSVTEIMEDIITLSNGSTEVLGQIFDSEAMRAFNFAIGEYKRTGAVTSLGKFNDMIGDGTTIQADAARRAGSLKANIQGLTTAFVKFADVKLSPVFTKLTESLNKLAEDPETFERIFKGIAVGIGAIATVKGISSILNLVNGFKALKGGGVNLSAGSMGGSGIPVHVTNRGGVAGTSLNAGSAGNNWQKISGATDQAVKNLTRKQYMAGGAASGIGAALVAVPQMIGELSAINQDETLKGKAKGKATGGAIGNAAGTVVGATIGGAAGVAVGAAAGAAIGSIVPGLGTIVGGLVGAGVGALGGWLGGKAGRAIGEGIGESVSGEYIPEEYNALSSNQWMGEKGTATLETKVIIEDHQTKVQQAVVNNFSSFNIPNTGSSAVARSIY